MVSSFLFRHFTEPSDRTLRIILVTSFTGLLILAWANRFVQDDAYISFRYAHNLAHGQGLVWNPGERIEGYTNFLWTLLMSVPIYFDRDPVTFSFAVGLILYFFSLLLTFKVALQLFDSRGIALLTVILLGTNYTFSAYATGGLETQLQTFLITAAVFLTLGGMKENNWSARRLQRLSLVAGLAVLTRPDSPLLLSVLIAFTVLQLIRAPLGKKQRLLKFASLVSPFSVLVGGWLIWKTAYYGEILPNTFYAKVSPSRALLGQGLLYLDVFLESYWLMPLLILLGFYMKRLVEKRNISFAILALSILLWLIYVVVVGGDFMEFRFLVPILPAVFILIGWLLFVQIRTGLVTAGLCLLVLLGSIHHAVSFDGWAGIDSVGRLSDYVRDSPDGLSGVGRMLGQAFNYDPNVTISVMAAGAIPYYSRLRTIDMFGMSDRWVARHGIAHDKENPAHQKLATLDYLIEREVNIIVGPIRIVDNGFSRALITDSPEAFGYLKILGSNPYKVAHLLKILEVRLDSEHRLFLAYLTKSKIIDEAIKRNGWTEYNFDPMKAETNRRPNFPTYELGSRIDLTSSEADNYLWYGWSKSMPPYRWSNRPRAAITFHLEQAVPCKLEIGLQAFIVPPAHPKQKVTVVLNGTTLTIWELKQPGIQTHSVELPAGILRQDNVLSFDLPDAESPMVLGVGEDSSLLAIDVRWLQITPNGMKTAVVSG
jgi:hypothetical protein